MDIEQTQKQIKKSFYAFRNGIIADTLRNSGDPHHYIMGLQLPDIITISQAHKKSAELSVAMWNDKDFRESRLIAPMLYPNDDYTIETAKQWCNDVETIEVADVLCHQLLRKLSYAQQLFEELVGSDKDIVRYTAFRLLLNLVLLHKIDAAKYVDAINNELRNANKPTENVLKSILEELDS